MVILKKYAFLLLILVAILIGYVSTNTIGLTFLLIGLFFSISLVLVTFLGVIFSKVSEKHQQITGFIFTFFLVALITTFLQK